MTVRYNNIQHNTVARILFFWFSDLFLVVVVLQQRKLLLVDFAKTPTYHKYNL